MKTRQNDHRNPSLIGLLPAFLIVGAWAFFFFYSIFFHELVSANLPQTLLLISVLTFLNTGLFITAHDAMHGVVAPGRPELNAWVGRLCVFLYAGFDWAHLLSEHHRHHASPGLPGDDPDFHAEGRPSYLSWYFHFFMHYFRWQQLAGILAIAVSMQVFLGAAQWNPLTFWALPGLLSSFQLFTFGTYLPHRRFNSGFPDRHNARTNAYPVWLSFLTCYHFGYHWEHHEWPHLPWWRLPDARRRSRS